jgi:heme A synthase
MAMPPALAALHRTVSLLGVLLCIVLLPLAFWRRDRSWNLLLTILVLLPASAVITGGLSTPHERYQARIMWLPPFAAALSLASLSRRRA